MGVSMAFRRLAAGVIVSFGLVGPSSADGPSRFSWTGFYFGANLGAGTNAGHKGSGTQEYTGLYSDGLPLNLAGPTSVWATDISAPLGAIGGLTAGYNLQVSRQLVVGIEADIQLSDVHATGSALTVVPSGTNGIVAHNGRVSANQRTDWFGTLRGRIGVLPVTPTLMLYATGGLAYGHSSRSLTVTDTYPTVPAIITGSTSANSVKVGWTAGAGAEWAIDRRWSLKGEWTYVDLGASTIRTTQSNELQGPAPFPIFRATQRVHDDFHLVRLGLNYKFGN